MEQQTLRKTFKYKLIPTPTQERELGRLLGLCRSLYNTALEQRITAWQRVRVTLSRYRQEAELKDIRAAFPEYAAIHSHVLQDVLARLDKTYQAFFRRLKAGEKAGFPRYQGRDRYHSFSYKEFDNDLLAEITSKRNYNDWLLEISSGTAVQFEERSSPRAWAKLALTTKLTTYWLDVLGRPWTMCRQESRIPGQIGRPWTTLDSAPRAPKPQGAGSIPVPPAC